MEFEIEKLKRDIAALTSMVDYYCNTLNLGVYNFFSNTYQIQVLPLVSLSL
jgi:hypothetical protein